MMLNCKEILDHCAALADMKSLYAMREGMVRAMAGIFNIRQVVLFGLDATNEKCIILAALPQLHAAEFSVSLDEADHGDHPVRWAFRQQKPVQADYEYGAPLTDLLKQALPSVTGKKVCFVPCIYLDNAYPELFFLFATEHEAVSPVQMELGMSFSRFCARLNRTGLRLEQYRNGNRLLAKSLTTADDKAKKAQRACCDALDRRMDRALKGCSGNKTLHCALCADGCLCPDSGRDRYR